MKTVFTASKPLLPRLRWQQGASLLEGIAYLGIAAIVILGAAAMLSNAFSSAQSNQTVQELVSLRTSVKKLYVAGGYGTGDLTNDIIAAGAFPTTLKVSAGAGATSVLTNSWNGDVSITGSGGSFVIQYNDVPEEECINILTGAGGWESIARTGGDTLTSFPVSLSDAVSTCSDDNTLTFEAT